MDTLTAQERSRIMGRVKGKHTRPEMAVRRLVYGMGYRYRLHGKGLPGRPDLVFRKRGKVIFVHGCFWHRHKGCPGNRLPKSRRDFWTPKLNANRDRDRRNIRALEKDGWRVLVVWECETRAPDGGEALARRLRDFLEDNGV